jgi:chromosome segregation ATPase
MEKTIMQSDKRTILLPIFLVLVFVLSSCQPVQRPSQVPRQTNSLASLQSDPIAKRFQESEPKNTTAVESAIELSDKYARLSEEASLLRQQNREAMAKNQQLENQVVNLQAQLDQAQKELTEANDMLIEMRVELNNWKMNILGYRDEMRDAETAQLEALFKILKALGGEVETDPDGKKIQAQLSNP